MIKNYVPPSNQALTASDDLPKSPVHSSSSEESKQKPIPTSTIPDVMEVVEAFKEVGIDFFHDEFGQLYADIPCETPEPHHEHWPFTTKSRSCRRRLRALFSARKGWTLPSSLLRDAIELTEATVDGQSKEITLSNRISEQQEAIWIDLADSKWRSILVDERGWSVVSDNTPRFRRHRHQATLPDPVRGGHIDELFDLIPTKDEGDRLLILTWLVSALIPSVTTPILVHTGQAGSAKSTRSRILRSLIDPSTTGILGESERSHLPQVMFHHAIPCFDNLGKFDRKESDFFCRAVTGAGFEKRQLFTDMDEVLFRFKRAIIVNAIELPTNRTDFLDRCLILQVDRIADFQPSNVIDEKFSNANPRLLGALLDLLVSTLRELPSTPPPTKFRMADYARVGRAVARVLKKTDDDFDAAYSSTIYSRAFESLDEDSFARSLREYVKGAEFVGTAQELLEKLMKFTKTKKDPKSKKAWPGNARWVMPRLMKLAPLLDAAGIRIEHLKRKHDCRNIRIYQSSANQQTRSTDKSQSPSS